MKIRILVVLAVLGSMLFAIDARGVNIGLFDYVYNVDGVVGISPADVDDSGFDYITGLGTISCSIGAAGNHFVGLFVDHEFDETLNTFFNEFGTAVCATPAGLSWEIDEPGYLFGDIFDNFSNSGTAASALDNATGVPGASPDDVSMALGWNFSLNSGEIAAIRFDLSTVAPSSGFTLRILIPTATRPSISRVR